MRGLAAQQASDDARQVTRVLARSVAEPAIPRGLVDGDAGAIDRFDREVLDRLLVGDVRRIKIWRARRHDRLLRRDPADRRSGSRSTTSERERARQRRHRGRASPTSPSRENRFETEAGGLLEVYTRIDSPEGEPLLFEAYYSADDRRSSARREVLDAVPADHGRRPARDAAPRRTDASGC